MRTSGKIFWLGVLISIMGIAASASAYTDLRSLYFNAIGNGGGNEWTGFYLQAFFLCAGLLLVVIGYLAKAKPRL